jgi:Isopropylmalate/homocitrate/citramalate synthases
MRSIKLLDCTLRDGGYINSWRFGEQTIYHILKRLSSSNIDIIECGFLSDIVYDVDCTLFSDTQEIHPFLEQMNVNALYVAMIAIGEKEIHPNKIAAAKCSKVKGIRLTFHADDKKKAFEYARLLMKKGYLVFMQPVGSANYSDDNLLSLVKEINVLKPYAFYIVDTLGTMFHDHIVHMISLINKNLDSNIALGYHSHNNLQLAFSNAQEMIRYPINRDIIIDCSVYGMGRGAGNLCTELITDYINHTLENKYNVFPLLEIIDEFLIPIYSNTSWGYSVGYYLASTMNCHPNYATHLLAKQSVPVRTIGIMLDQIPEEKRNIFDKEYIENMYLNYQKHDVDDKEEIEKLHNELNNKQILIIAPGRNIITYKKKIQEFIQKNKPYIIATNFLPDYPVDMIFMGNERRYHLWKEKAKSHNVIFTSNIIRKPDNARVVNYSDLINSSTNVSDSTGLMLLKLLVKTSVKKVTLAGFDGFRKNSIWNYYDENMIGSIDAEAISQKNKSMILQLKKRNNDMEINFLTPTKYKLD